MNTYIDTSANIIPWSERIITVEADIQRDKEMFGRIRFSLKPAQYADFMNLEGTYKGTLLSKDFNFIVKLLPTDVIIIYSDNYEEIKKEYENDKKVKDERG